MPTPSVMNLVDIVVQQIQLDPADTYQDPDYRETSLVASYDDPITLQGQVNFGTKMWSAMIRTLTGTESRTRGHLVFRTSDLDGSGITLQVGDKVTSIAGRTNDLVIDEVRYESPLNGAFLLCYAMLKNNPETKASN